MFDESAQGVEHPLSGGNASGAVVRVGDTVRKPWAPSTPSVLHYLEALGTAGIDLPRSLGRDRNGRQVIEFVPGTLAIDMPPLDREQLHRIGGLVRRIHDASAGFLAKPGAVWDSPIEPPAHELVCHNDLAPWNLIIGDRLVFIDWDAAAPSTRLWDLAYAAQSFTLNDTSRSPSEAALDLAAFVDGYNADSSLRDALPQAMYERARAMFELLEHSHEVGREPWGTMFTRGHGAHWRSAAAFVRNAQAQWIQALSKERCRPQ
ncbi:phosphotransferase [Humidisolicoccus flavus]|uniref:phosphotransferase n=1 Tax=Humidisolicoccus flavus TaxID=3111414 RepID=UPI003252D1AE